MHEYFLPHHASAAGQAGLIPAGAQATFLDPDYDSVARHSRNHNPAEGPEPRYAPFAYGSLSTARTLYWTDIEGTPVGSTSQGALRRIAKRKLDQNRVRLALCSNLPGFLRHLPFWEGVHAVQPGFALTFSDGRAKSVDLAPVAGEPFADLSDAAHAMSGALKESIAGRLASYGTVSADVSGGMDSTSLAFFLDALQEGSIFYHAGTDDPQNRDSEFARRAADVLRGRLIELESLTSTSAAFGEPDPAMGALDDGPPGWAANSHHLGALFADAARRGVRAHLTGIGGDELFDPLPAMALGLLSTSSWRAGVRVLRRLGKMQRWPALALGRAVASKVGFDTEVLRRAGNPGNPVDGPGEAFSWAPGFGLSRFATKEAREAVAYKVREGLERGARPHHAERFRHQMTESLMFQGEIARQVNHAYSQLGVAWEAPFLDDHVIRLVHNLPVEAILGVVESKPLLARATNGVVPRWIFTREDKGEYSSDLFQEFKARRRELSRLFDDSCLVDMGHVDPTAVRSALSMPVIGTDELYELEHLAGVERWIRRLI
ncbi:asparagine synthase-related protein [Paenarthrobacter sp. NPDC089714]|uniref:asparagine synthase-related protein n=1 Tax=Paenarthrobacter sp. NPDC089714 TaxID=3364377 RepID=UPI003814F0C9